MAAISEVKENADKRGKEVFLESKTSQRKVNLESLKVADLKNELEKRKLDKNGVKNVLIERLKAAIVEEGGNPEEYEFIISDTFNKNIDNCTILETCDSNEIKDDTNSTDIQHMSNEVPIEDCNIKDLNEVITETVTKAEKEGDNNEEKQDVPLQLSIDEEDAQLNEENLIEYVCKSKSEEVENTTDKAKNAISTSDEVSTEKQSLPVKVPLKPDEEKKLHKNSQSTSSEVVATQSAVKTEKIKSPSVLTKGLWITGLPNSTRAADLKALFSKQGRVLNVKIVKSAKQKPGKCYGFVTMATSKDAMKAIQNLHGTELHNHVISVERKSSEPSTIVRTTDSKNSPGKKTSTAKKEMTPLSSNVKKNTSNNSTAKAESKTGEKKPPPGSSVKKNSKASNEKSKDSKKSSEHSNKTRDLRPPRRQVNTRPRTYGYNDRPRYVRQSSFRRPNSFGSNLRTRPNFFSLQQMKEDRFLRERREDERRRLEEATRHRYIERKQREEAFRLEREKERLRIERELLERERAEIIKLEREKQRLERERLEREREELRVQAMLRPSLKRSYTHLDREVPVWSDRKKPTIRYEGRSSLHETSRFEYPSKGSNFGGREFDTSFSSAPKHVDDLNRSIFSDTRREVSIRARDERQVFNRNDFRDNRRLSSRRENTSRSDWKSDRRINERASSSSQRRMNYY